jgi:hypothetical protein
MARVLTLFVVGCLLLAACGDDAATGATSTSTTVSMSTTTLATTTTSTTTTTVAPTTTAEAASFYTKAQTPPGELDSFTGRSEMTFAIVPGGELEQGEIMGGGAVVITDATYVGNAYECISTLDTMGFSMTMVVVATPETVWVGADGVFDETYFSDPNVQGVTSMCAASPMIWLGFDATTCATGTGAPEEIDGIPARRIDLSATPSCLDFIDLVAVFGYGHFPESAEYSEVIFWIADPGGWPVAIQAHMDLSEEAMAELWGIEGLGAGTIDLRMEIDNVNDPTLSVQVPPG